MIRIAIPNKGRIAAEVVRLLEKIGIEVPENGRKLYSNTSNPGIQVIYARAADIPLYVQAGVADLGVTGEDMLCESQVEVKKLLKLNFGKCSVAVAAPEELVATGRIKYGQGLTVATKLPNIAKGYFEKLGVRVRLVKLAGAVELAPRMKMADLIVDQVSTGTTLEANGLKIVERVMESEICLIANKESLRNKSDPVEEIRLSLESVINAEQKRYIIANVPDRGKLRSVLGVMPSMESPTILKLAKKGAYAVQSVVDSAELMKTMRRLRGAGAKDILVMNVTRVTR